MISHELQQIIQLLRSVDEKNAELVKLLLSGNTMLADELLSFFEEFNPKEKNTKFTTRIKIVIERIKQLQSQSYEYTKSMLERYGDRIGMTSNAQRNINRLERRLVLLEKFKPFL